MNGKILEWIAKKRDREILTASEIRAFVQAVTDDAIPDYQVASMLMAMFINGLSDRETYDLTMAICDSGEQIDLSRLPGIKVDKHSTGGVGDTTTLVLLPLIAACGAPVVKMSGRGLGFTGGTIDKLESIPGFCVSLSIEQAVAQCRQIGIAILGQTASLCPADRKLYAMRDVTATVDSIPLIAASIMSKKIAAGADAIVLDVKCGNGAFMKDIEQARALAATMVRIGKTAGRRVVAVISGMDQPLGTQIGNTLEVAEAIDVLAGRKTGDLLEVSLLLGSHMLVMAQIADTLEAARALMHKQLANGSALEKLRQLIAAQGGNPAVCDQPRLLPAAPAVGALYADKSGYVAGMNTEKMGHIFVSLGGGRLVKNQEIDATAGLVLACRLGDAVRPGDVLAWVHGASHPLVERKIQELRTCISIAESRPAPTRRVLETIT